MKIVLISFVLGLGVARLSGSVEPSLRDFSAVRRRSVKKYVAPPESTEQPYDSAIQFGRGWNHVSGSFVAHAFEPYTAEIYSIPSALQTVYERRVVTKTSEFNKAMKATALVEAKGWSMKAKVESSFERDVTMQQRDALFVLHASKQLGFEGWSFEHVPPLRQAAKEALCAGGIFTPEKFQRIYGSYYVRGERKATALDVYVRLETQTTSSTNKVSASLEAAWSGYGASVNGGASFSHQMSREQSSSRLNIEARSYGTATDWLPAVTADNLDEIVEEYEQRSADGAGVALQLTRYNDHPDYIEIEQTCGESIEVFQRDEALEELYVDIAVEAKLLFDEIVNGCPVPGAYDVAGEAWILYNNVLDTPEDQFTFPGYVSLREELDALLGKFERDLFGCVDLRGKYELITSNDCEAHGYQFITSKSECETASAAVGVVSRRAYPSGNRAVFCGTWESKRFLHFNSPDIGYILSAKGSVNCPHASEVVTTKEECFHAMHSIQAFGDRKKNAINHSNTQWSRGSVPSGCFKSNKGYYHFNAGGDTITGSYSQKHHRVCRMTGHIKGYRVLTRATSHARQICKTAPYDRDEMCVNGRQKGLYCCPKHCKTCGGSGCRDDWGCCHRQMQAKCTSVFDVGCTL